MLKAIGMAMILFAAADDVVRFDFETGDLQGWQVVEGWFDKLVSDRTEFHNGGRYNKQGKYYLSTVEQHVPWSNDKMTGVVESPVFELTGPRMSMLVGGGDYPDTYVALCLLDGKEVRHARGRRTETMFRVEWDAADLIGRKVFLRVVDRSTQGWGHVTLDDFTAQGRIDSATTRERFAEIELRRLRSETQNHLAQVDLASLRPVIEDLSRTFPQQYPRGTQYLRQLAAWVNRLPEIEQLLRGDRAALERAEALITELRRFQREALVANPLVSGQPLLYVVRNQYRQGGHHAIDTLFHTCEINTNRFEGGGSLKMIDLATGKVPTPSWTPAPRASCAIRRSTSTAGGSSSPCAATSMRIFIFGRYIATARACGS